MVAPFLPYGRQSIDDDDVEAVVSTLRGDWLTQGPAVGRFEEALCEATGAKYAVAVASGTAALHLSALAAGIGPGDHGITSTITFVASANCMRYAGATPHFCDVDPATGLLSLASLRSEVERLSEAGEKPRLIVPVDLTGACPDLGEVRRIADAVGAMVVEDAAHSLGTTYDGGARRAGDCTHAHMAILSFHPVKHVTTGEGGAILTGDEGLYRELLDLRTHGITKDPARLTKIDGPWYYEQRALGFNYRITDVQCALGASQLRKLGRFVARRRELAARYDRAFGALAAHVRPLAVPTGCRSAYHLYVVNVTQQQDEPLGLVAERRKNLYLHLRERGIGPQVHYIPVHTQPDFRSHGLGQGSFPGADRYYAGALSLPLFPTMSDEDVDRVVGAVAEGLGAS